MMLFQSLYDSNKFVRAIANKLGFSRPNELALISPRIVEYPWVLRNLPSNGRVLDVGSTGSQLPVMLAGLGYEVWTIDVRQYEFEGVSKNLRCKVGDIRKTDFPENFFDIVLAVSTIEHVGIGRYGDPIDFEGDKKAMKEIIRIMKNEGLLLMTVPFGKQSISRFHRSYDTESLLAILGGFNIKKIEYFIRTDMFWINSLIEQVKDIDSSVSERAIACVNARAKE